MTPTETLQPGKQFPNWSIKDHSGASHTIWDYRQKSHVVLIYEPEQLAERKAQWLSAIQADRRQWDWLNVTFILVKEGPKDINPGVYVIDRYGIFVNSFASNRWNFNDLEREFIYYEARHC
jgi:hypothetical protein